SEVDLRPEIRRQIEQHQEKLAHYRTIEERDFLHGGALTREARIQHMILKKGILYEEASIGWAQEMLDVLA
ncbi:MAG TPA: PadR family transcriptional regulator, partial [Noviherbaspirillum sp.]|nr:PadR family transcriptional regulator [Noviherbaspirillum sp.]